MRYLLRDYAPPADHSGDVPVMATGKFVQITGRDRCFLVRAPKELMQYHAQIVERFCRDEGIAGRYDEKRTVYRIDDRDWKVLGGGKYAQDREKGTLRFFDESLAYGRFDAAVLREMGAAIPALAGSAITIE